jgi:RHS repeat-associated protein
VLGIVLFLLVPAVLGLAAVLLASPACAADLPSPEPTVVREVVEKRAEYSNTYLLSDGQYRCVSYASPVNYLANGGSWLPIDTSLLPTGSLDVYATTATPVEVTVADETSGQRSITVSDGDWTVTMDLLGWAEDDKLVVDDVALYTDVAPATDVAYTVLGNGIKEVITLSSPEAPNTFTYRLTHPGLELRQDADGGWGFYRPAAKEAVFIVGNMSTCDSSLDEADEPAWCAGAYMTVSPGKDSSTITYTVPRHWMDDPARIYPLKIDPDLGNPVALDTYLSLGLPTQSFGSDEDLLCGRMNSSADKCRTLVQFPQVNSDIPAGSHATGASFRLRQFWQPATHSDAVYVSQLADGSWWTENSTYNGANGRMAMDYNWPAETVSGTGVWMSISCAAVVNDWIVNGGNNGFIVYETDASGSAYSRKFRSHEYTGTDYDPRLEVTYTEPTVAVTSPTSLSTVYQGKSQAISWTMPSCFGSGHFKVEVVSSAGVATTVQDNIQADGRATPYTCSAWIVSQAAGSGWTARVSYYTSAGGFARSASSQPFTIYDGTPTVQSPNGGESWLRGSVHDITWTAQTLPSGGHFRVEYEWPGGARYVIADYLPVTQRSCEWTILMAPASGWQARVTYVDAVLGDIAYDRSDGTFTIADCSPTVTAPNGGESLYLGTSEHITWTAPALTYGHFNVELVDSGGAATTVNASVAPNGTTNYDLPWTVDRAVASGWKVRVRYYNAAGTWIGTDESNAGFAIIPDEEVQHTTTDLGSWDGHGLACELDTARLTAEATDLAIASLGPQAALTRSYLSGEAATRFAPGWRFGLEQKLVFDLGADPASVTYVDEAQGTHAFYRADATSIWQAPNGYFAHLTQNGDGTWKLLYDDQHYLTFATDGTLLAETDIRGRSTTYSWSSNQVVIQAANAQQIVVSIDGTGKVTGASYGTSDGTRTVAYSGGGATWHVTYNAADTGANGTARTLDYTYAGSLLSDITQPGWPEAGESVLLRFTYSGTQLTGVNYPDMYSTDTQHTVEKPDARATITYGANQATVERYGTYVDGSGEHTNAAMQPVEYHWQPPSSPVAGQETKEIAGTGEAATLTNYEYSDDQQVESTTTYEGDDEGGDVLEDWDADIDAVDHEIDSETVDTGDEDSIDQVTTYAYDDQHRVTDEVQIAEPSPSDPTEGKGTTTLYTYDGAGNAIEEWKEYRESATATPAVCAYTRRTYDAAGHLTTEKQLVSADFVETGHLGSGETPDDRAMTTPVWAETDYADFAPCGEPQTIEAKAVKLRLAHDGNPEIITDLTRTAAYDDFGNLESETDWGGRTTQASTYDLAGRELTSTDAAGVVTHTSYDLLGNATTSFRTAAGTDMKADWRESEYDAMGRAVTVTTKLSDASGNLTTQREATSVYDGSGHQLSAHDSTVGGQDEKWVYDANGNVTKHWALGVSAYDDARATRTAYDDLGQVTGESQPGNTAEPGSTGSDLTSYDDVGQVTSRAHADGSSSGATYDGTGSQLEDQSSVTGTATSDYGADGRLASQTDASGLTTTYGYDLLGRVTGAQGSASAGSSTTTCNSLGWVLQTIDSSGATVTRDHDAHGNVDSETKGSAGTTNTTYDALNRVLTRTDPNEDVLTNTYDAFGNLHEAKHQDWSTATLKDVVTDHDSLGRPTSQSESVSGRGSTWTYPVNTPGGIQETLSYDSTPLTQTVVARNSRGMETSRTTTIASDLTLTRSIADPAGRDQADRWTSASLQLTGYGALTLGRSFDNAGRVATQSGAGFISAGSYSYNATSGLKSNQTLPLALGGTINDNYTYWPDGRLHTWGSASYSFDSAGNLTSDGTTTYAYSTSGTPNRLVSSTTGGATTLYGWDQANAWRTSQGPSGNPSQIQYTYAKSGASTSNGRMTRYQNAATVADATYSYDASGQRTKSVVTVGAATTTTDFAYDRLTLLKLTSTQSESTWRIDYLSDEEGVPYGGVYRSPADSTSPTYFAMITNDHGDVLELLDGAGNAFAAYRYDPWGLPYGSGNYATGIWTQSTSLITSTLAGQIASRQVLRYAGYAYDAESSLYYCSARYYDPGTRQWTTCDPVKADGEESAYHYCSGRPIGATDPAGRWTQYLCRLAGSNAKGWRTESWYWFRQVPDVNKTTTADGVAEFVRVGARNLAPKGRWVTWQALVQERDDGWLNWLFHRRQWVVKSRRAYFQPYETRTTRVHWLSLDLVDTKIRTFGWGGAAHWGSNSATRYRYGWFGLYDTVTESRG